VVDALSHMYVLLSTLDARFPIVLVPRYKLSLCHTPIKPDLFSFLRIEGVWVALPCVQEVRVSMSSCALPVLLVPKKDGT
jgi:hypothetical protein